MEMDRWRKQTRRLIGRTTAVGLLLLFAAFFAAKPHGAAKPSVGGTAAPAAITR
jgi:hypothetical protein